MKNTSVHTLLAILLILLAASLRIGNASLHWHNVAPLAAIGLFSGAVIKDKRLAFLVPVAGQFLADMYFQLFTHTPGFYDLPGQLTNYVALIAAAMFGTTLKQIKPVNSLLYIFGASTLFFLISNFGYFIGGWNGYTVNGLIKTYVDGIPFFKYTIAGDLVGGIVLFGTYMIATRKSTSLAGNI